MSSLSPELSHGPAESFWTRFADTLKKRIDSNHFETWLARVGEVLTEATLTVPDGSWMQSGGIDGHHSEHLGYLLAEMQFLQRAYPNANW